MLLDPINSVTSINFYKKIAGQSLGRTFLYLAYLGMLFSLVFLFFLKTRIWPSLQETFQWLQTSVPAITYSKGRLSTPTNEKVILRHPKINGIAFAIDTGRVEPVTSKNLEEDKVMSYVTSTALYIQNPGGRVDVYDFSKVPSAETRVFDAKFYQELSKDLGLVLFPLGVVTAFAAFMLWKIVATLFYSMIALLLNGVTEAGLAYRPLFNISVYAQTLVVVVQGILLLIPARVPQFSLLAALATTIYLWLAIKKTAAPAPQIA